MIDLEVARELLDFGARIGPGQRADEQLQGAVALHNVLKRKGVAYLADEVGMGKTYVALGALALFRHFQPNFRVLVIAPRENIQYKWIKEFRNFVAHNVRFADLRIKSIDDRPARPLTSCGNLLEFVSEATRDPNRDFFLRLSSFSLPLRGDSGVNVEDARYLRQEMQRHLPWLRDEAFDLRNKQTFKDRIAAAICCALPKFDLVIVDEGHNLKHGFSAHVSARNRVLALTMGRTDERPDPKLFPGFGPRATRVLFLSATPVEDSYRQLWNQLDVFGLAEPYRVLCCEDQEEEAKKDVVGQFLIRRVTSIRIGGEEHTKNLYRREWRRGGVADHDEPIRITDPRQRLTVALVQKKVSEILGSTRFNSSFQIGMLASFESFLETTGVKRADADEGNFDDAEQTENREEREGVDVSDVNRLARSHRETFAKEMPHPKMDALVESLAGAWKRGTKTLVFVRRVASVKELKRKLDELYDQWLIGRLERELPSEVRPRLSGLIERYRQEKLAGDMRAREDLVGGRSRDHDVDRGGTDTFFAWFFRGEGPARVISGANIQQRFIQRGAAYATFFEDNYVADVLRCPPGEVEATLALRLGVAREQLRSELQERSRKFLSRAKKHPRADRLEAVQAAAIEWLKGTPGEHQEQARIVWHQRFESSMPVPHTATAPDIGDWLEHRTFFTELRLRHELRRRLWPESTNPDPVDAFRERELRAQLLASAARLGHAFIDLYVMTIRRLGSLELRAQEAAETEGVNRELERIGDYLDLLERQLHTSRDEREWGAFDELADLSAHFDLILDCNAAEVVRKPLSETAKLFGQLLRQQQPVGGMYGQLNQTLIRQFRMPGYPLVLITTDLLQEGEDLHTFCSSVHHYGVSWTPSSMEQRIGRIDRVRSQTDRRLSAIIEKPRGEDLLQVYFPHLSDTIEVLQVERVLERMNIFLRLMHEGLLLPSSEVGSIDTKTEFAKTRRGVPQIRTLLETAFPIQPDWLRGDGRPAAAGPEVAARLRERFAKLQDYPLTQRVVWEPQLESTVLLGTAYLKRRVQPFMLVLRSFGSYPLLSCISPIGRMDVSEVHETVLTHARQNRLRIGLIETDQESTYNLTIESDVLLTNSPDDDAVRLSLLLDRVLQQADDLERELFPGEDAELVKFRDDLQKDSKRGR